MKKWNIPLAFSIVLETSENYWGTQRCIHYFESQESAPLMSFLSTQSGVSKPMWYVCGGGGSRRDTDLLLPSWEHS